MVQTTTVPEAAQRLGISKYTIYQAIREDRWTMPIRVIRVGTATRLVTADLDKLLGEEPGHEPERTTK